MPIIMPSELINSNPSNEATQSFIAAENSELATALVNYEALDRKAIRRCVLLLVENAIRTDLNRLRVKLNILEDSCVENGFLYNLLIAIDLKLLILDFEENKFSNLDNFVKFDADYLRKYSSIVLELSKEASMALALEIEEEYTFEQFCTLKATVQSLQPTFNGIDPPSICEAFATVLSNKIAPVCINGRVQNYSNRMFGSTSSLDKDYDSEQEPDACSFPLGGGH